MRCCLQLFHRLICYSSPPSSVSYLLFPASLLSCLLHISLYTAPISVLASLVSSCTPHVTLDMPLSSVVFHRPSFLRVQHTVICSSPVSQSSSTALPSRSSLNSTILRLSARLTLAIFRTQLFSHTCSRRCCSSVRAKVSVPYRHAGVTQVLMTLPFSLFEISRSAITPSTTLHAFAPACSLRRTSLSVFPSPHTAPPRYTKLSR